MMKWTFPALISKADNEQILEKETIFPEDVKNRQKYQENHRFASICDFLDILCCFLLYFITAIGDRDIHSQQLSLE